MVLTGFCWLLVSVVPVILIVSMFVRLVRHEYKRSRTLSSRCNDVTLAVTIFALYSIFTVHVSVDQLYIVMIDITGSKFDPLWCISSWIELTWFSYAKLLMYLFFIVRLHMVFSNSSFAVSQFKLKLIGVMVSLPTIFVSIVGFVNAAQMGRHIVSGTLDIEVNSLADCNSLAEHQAPLVVTIQNAALPVYLLAELIYSVVILRLFLSRIMLVSLELDIVRNCAPPRSSRPAQSSTVSQTKSNTLQPPDLPTLPGSINSNSARTHARVAKHKKRNDAVFLNLAIKITNLIILAICSNYLVMIKFALNTPTAPIAIDAVCNCVSVYLTYKFAQPLYDRLFGACHNRCHNCCAALCYCCCVKMPVPVALVAKETVVNEKTEPGKSVSVDESVAVEVSTSNVV